MADVNHEQRVGQTVHVLDAAQAGFQLVALTAQAHHFVLDQLLERAVGFSGFQFLQTGNRLLHGGEVGQRAAQPALGHEGLAATFGFFLDGFTCAALGAKEQDGTALLCHAADEIHRVVEHRNGLFQVDDMDLAAGTEDVRTHLGVPVTGLVTEVNACFKHLAHGDLGHCKNSKSRWNPRQEK